MWLCLAISAVCVIFVLTMLLKLYQGLHYRDNAPPAKAKSINVITESVSTTYLYVFGNLLSQGWLLIIKNDAGHNLSFNDHNYRHCLEAKSTDISYCRGFLASGGYRIGTSLYVDSLHLRDGTNQSASRQFSLWHCCKLRYSFIG